MKIIKIDKTSRIEIIPKNYVLQYYRKIEMKNEEKKYAWHTDGYFPDMASLAIEFINNAPRASNETIQDVKKLIKVIETAELNVIKILDK